MRAEEERKAREHYRRSMGRGGKGSKKMSGRKSGRRRPAKPSPDPKVLTEGRTNYGDLYDAAAAEAEADIAALRGDGKAQEERPETGGGRDAELPHLRMATPWKIGGLQTVVHAELFDPATPIEALRVSPDGVVTVPDSVAVDVSAFYWQRPSTGTQPTQSSAPPFQAATSSDAAPTHNPDNFTRGLLRLNVHDTVSELDHAVVARVCVYARPAHPDGLPPPRPEPAIATPLPHVVLLSRVLEACYYDQPPTTSTDAAQGRAPVADNMLHLDADFICADAVNPAGRHRPIMCHARKFGKDMVIVSLHTVEAKPGQGDVDDPTSPRFVLQAYNYTKRKFIAANLTQEQLMKSEKPFLKQAAQVYFANLENRPASPASRATTAASASQH